MRKPLVALAAFGLTIGLASVSLPAYADEPCSIDDFSPHVVVVGLSPVVTEFDPPAVSGCESLEGWTIEGGDYDFYVYDGSPQEVFRTYDNSETARKDVVVTAHNGDYDERSKVFPNGFALKRLAAWKNGSFNASPEPVTAGRAITIKGTLILADWTNRRYSGYTNRDVVVEFRAANTANYVAVKTVKTGSGGTLRTTVTAKRDGRWRVRYAGGYHAGAATSIGDWVDVR